MDELLRYVLCLLFYEQKLLNKLNEVYTVKATFHYSINLQTWLQTWLSTRFAARFSTSSCGFATCFRHAFEFFVENLVANLLHQSRRAVVNRF